MTVNFGSFGDDFFINVDLHTSLELPRERETILHFCETAQKNFPDLSDFYQRDSGAHVLEGDRQSGRYRWMEIDKRRLSGGAFNPEAVEDAYKMHQWILDRSRYFLGISHLDVESLDLVYGFNLDYVGNRDAIVCDALLAGSPLGGIVQDTGAMVLNFEPSIVVAGDADCSLQARLAIETRTDSLQSRSGSYAEEPISVYFTIRVHPQPSGKFDMLQSLHRQRELGEDMLARVIVPQIVRPIASAISTA